jgi:hypothetical protein
LLNEVYGYACSDHDEDGVDFELVDSHGSTYGGGTVRVVLVARGQARLPGAQSRSST